MTRITDFFAWAHRTPKDIVVKFLREEVTERVNSGMTKGQMLYLIDRAGYTDGALKRLNDLRGHIDYLWIDHGIFKPRRAVRVQTYKGYHIELNEGIYEVVAPNRDIFVVALDDSKMSGKKRIIPSANNLATARKYIDWVTK